jgi:hypothetical protein
MAGGTAMIDIKYVKERLNIKTNFDYPPVPVRDYDWSAVFDGYEPGCPVGLGKTEEDAILDLLDSVE